MPKQSNIEKAIATRIRDRREDLGLSQRELSEKLFLSHNFIRRVESGIISLKIWHVEVIAAALETSPLYLMWGGEK